MPRALVSSWKRVATSGLTVDNREISPQELRDIAQTYNPRTYTAVIWSEHLREHGSHGTVFAVRLVEEGDDLEPGQVALEAQLKPNDRLLHLNDQGEKLFTSIEIRPNFMGSGKSYLVALAVTDQPACVGTQELYFSCKSADDAYRAASVELGDLSDMPPQGEVQKLLCAFSSFFKRFGLEAPLPPPSPTLITESTPAMDNANAQALQAISAQLLHITDAVKTLSGPAVATPPAPAVEPVVVVEPAVVQPAAATQEFALQAQTNLRLTNIETLLTQAFNTTQGRLIPLTPSGEANKTRVL